MGQKHIFRTKCNNKSCIFEKPMPKIKKLEKIALLVGSVYFLVKTALGANT